MKGIYMIDEVSKKRVKFTIFVDILISSYEILLKFINTFLKVFL